MVSIEFCGAAKTVTGSNYLVKTPTATFLIDCGMFQGKDVEHLNLEELEYDPSKIDFVLLTHSHIDHSGLLPKLFKEGFKGSIFATGNTIQITTELLLDSAKLQEHAFQRGEFFGKYTQIKGIVFNTSDSMGAISLFKAVNFEDEFTPAEGITVKYVRAGHILGAASIEVSIMDDNTIKKFVFSGDLGRLKSHLIPTFDLNYRAEPDYIIMESLYGGQVHTDRDQSTKELIDLINQTIKNNGNVFIPCFAVQRTQEVLNDLKNAKKSGELAADVPVWLDSPLAQRITAMYTAALQHGQEDLFDFEGLNYVNKYKQSLKLTKMQGQVIIAGSGMADGGRIVEHLTTGLENSKNTVIFVGFQAEGTLGRELVEGAKEVRIETKTVRVNALVKDLDGFSAHGDQNDYTEWVKRLVSPNLKKVFLIHSEIERSTALKTHFETLGINNCAIPGMKDVVEV